ncbi:hypothetical protein TPA0909_35940 [Streptomyces albus]|nr:hypothetical protein TPA0909_35940 [Streptomyces albus]
MATMAGPGLIDLLRIITTRMTANSTTTDSEMATTAHTLMVGTSPGPGVCLVAHPPALQRAPIVPPTAQGEESADHPSVP